MLFLIHKIITETSKNMNITLQELIGKRNELVEHHLTQATGLIDIKKTKASEYCKTFDIKIFRNLKTTPLAYQSLVALKKEEVVEVLKKEKLYPTDLSVALYHRVIDYPYTEQWDSLSRRDFNYVI